MARQVFLSGHGGWQPNDGYTPVPKGCRIHFYTDFAKNLITGMEYMILRGEYTTIARTVGPFMHCPNLVLSHQDQEWTEASARNLATRNDIEWALITPPAGRFRLSQIFDFWSANRRNEEADFHWLACQTLGLKQVGGRALGLNAGDFAHDPTRPGRYRVTAQGPNGQIVSWI